MQELRPRGMAMQSHLSYNHKVQDNLFFQMLEDAGLRHSMPIASNNAIALDSDAHLFSRRLSDSCLSDDQPLELTASLGSQVFDWPWLLGRDCPGRGLCVVGCFEFGVDGGCAPMASTITLRVSLHSRWHPGFRLVSRSHSDSCLSDDQPLGLTASLGSQVFNWPRLLGRDCPGGGLSVVALWVAGF